MVPVPLTACPPDWPCCTASPSPQPDSSSPSPPRPACQVITSSALPGWEDYVTLLASTTQPQAGGGGQQLRLRVPRVHAYFTGTGGWVAAAAAAAC